MPYALKGCVVHVVVPCLYAGLYAACTHHSQASPGCCTLGCARVSGDTTELGWAPRAGRRLGRAARAAQRQPRAAQRQPRPEAAQRQDRGSLEAAQRQARAQSRGNPEQPRGRPEAAQSTGRGAGLGLDAADRLRFQTTTSPTDIIIIGFGVVLGIPRVVRGFVPNNP